LTYGFGNTSIKLGRQELPQSLSPFAYSEDWNVFKNTYDALVVVNTDLPNTTLVGAYVKRANFNMYGFFPALIPPMPSMNDFIALGDNGVYMLTAQNKSIDNVTLTGSYYMANDFAAVYDLDIMWADAQIGLDGINIGLQGGKVSLDAPGFADTKAYGAKIEGKVSSFDLGFAYSHINDSSLGMFNVGGTTSALYTETLLDQTMPSAALLFIPNLFRNANDKYMLKASTELWGGKITGSFTMTDHDYVGDISEIDLCYTTKLTDNVDLKAAFAHGSFDTPLDDIDMLRVVARYNF